MGHSERNRCDICGTELVFSEARPLGSGILCPDCAGSLSPFLDEARIATASDIRRHLACRAENEALLALFLPSLSFAGDKTVYIDPISERFIVTPHADWRVTNPDLFTFSQVLRVTTDVRTCGQERSRSESGGQTSGSTRSSCCEYAFLVTIDLDSPWVSTIALELSAGNRPTALSSSLALAYDGQMHMLADILMRRDDRFRVWDRNGGGMQRIDSAAKRPPKPAPAPQPSGVQSWICPACGSKSRSKKFCEQCGALRPARQPVRCASCGWEPKDPAKPPKFCPSCGTRFL